MTRSVRVALLAALSVASIFCLPAAPGRAQPAQCTPADFAKAVDDSARALRDFNAENAPKLQARLRKLKDRKGWTDADYEERAHDYLRDARADMLDQQASDLLTKIDTLGREDKPGDCAKLDDLKAAGVELVATMKAKSAHMFARIDAELGSTPPPASPTAPPKKPPAVAKTPPPAPKAAPPKQEQPPTSSWSTDTRVDPSAGTAPPHVAVGPAPPPEAIMPPPAGDEDGYTIDEIREATRGFFGTISTGLASVIEHAFRKSGRPSAYVLGTEGGGAFLAGLRYGSGTLYMRRGGTAKVYWHGPTLGYDIGAEGSRTMFLIYRLGEPGQLFRRFTGIDGSAYLVGGIGITFLKGGDVLMAPIRSGVGLRLGANIGYVRFTAEPSWNPF